MPYTDKEQARKASKERMRKHRLHPDVTPDNVTPSVTPDNVTQMADNVTQSPIAITKGITKEGALHQGVTKRGIIVLSDGQVLDLDNQPEVDLTRISSIRLAELRAWASAPEFRPLQPKSDKSLLKKIVKGE